MTDQFRPLRISALPLTLKCPESRRVSEIPIGGDSEPAERGTEIHYHLARIVMGGAMPALRDEEAMKLIRFGAAAWRDLAPSLPNPMVEQTVDVRIGDLLVTGHLDVGSLLDDGPEIRILDFKSGWRQDDYFDQMLGYGLAVGRAFDAALVRLSVAWLRTYEIETHTFTRDDLERFARRVESTLAQGGYNPGRHCADCPRRLDCPAKTAMVRAGAEELAAMPPVALADLPPSGWRELRAKLKLVAAALDQMDAMIRAEIAATGPKDLGDGRALALVEEPRDTILSEPGWPVLVATIGQEAALRAVRLSKTEIMAQCSAQASGERGAKKSAKETLMAALTDAGAIQSGRVVKLKEIKSKGEDHGNE